MKQLSIFDMEFQPEPKQFEDYLPCDTCEWDDRGCCSYDVPLGRTCVLGNAYRKKVKE